MVTKINTSVKQKFYMALMGVLWIAYLSVHSLSSLSYFLGAEVFNSVNIWFNSGIFWRYIVPVLLVLSLVYHIYIATTKQLKNLGKQNKYYKKYPHDISRIIPWVGVGFFFLFLIAHIYQMWDIDITHSYDAISALFSNILFVIFYLLASVTILFHIHHGLHNISQTLALGIKIPIVVILLAIGSGFISVPLFVLL